MSYEICCCGEPFIKKVSNQKYCSRRCKDNHRTLGAAQSPRCVDHVPSRAFARLPSISSAASKVLHKLDKGGYPDDPPAWVIAEVESVKASARQVKAEYEAERAVYMDNPTSFGGTE